ncbi:hypothetical protein BT96DRAFT_995897 [Gymnopus androsaceus JB14]|uniref:Uncharacterized protein n=1 Tax=Gymnopus androsaceus JB14 TaxID=1447944 RepID=A0A6A4HI06_9AGAR|nr:hypothetical protein BT96DRAFT_995897 [Gymnopus androsaceus JB14]
MTTAKLVTSHKRRKLSSPKLSAISSSSIATPASPAANKNMTLTCISCHRRAQSASRSVAVFCARCGSATCTICSRTCTVSSTPPDSLTPSQAQTYSSRRFALTLNSANTNSVGIATNAGGKRKKVKDDDVERDGAIRFEEGELPCGCGRIVCKNCCFESNQK